MVVFAVAFIALTEGLHALMGDRADDLLGQAAMAAALPAVLAAVVVGGRRRATALPSWYGRGHVRLAAAAFGITLVIAGLARVAVGWATVTFQPHASGFRPGALALTVGLITLAAFAEEILFRAWLPQAIGVWVRSPWVAYGVTVPLFVLIHGTRDGWIGVVNHGVTGICLAVLAWHFHGIAAPTGVHAASNVVLALAPELLTTGANMDHAAAVVMAKAAALVAITALLVKAYMVPRVATPAPAGRA
ncbi:CPBP family intramembrane glutamic endopeptidase [Luteococcus sp. H138]|uniref:CPBP family intramembrane glutamic endopeptidase n=1 Tax=unclassified Luteococcus TaxID=2639923 RepID=UPI00313F15DD